MKRNEWMQVAKLAIAPLPMLLLVAACGGGGGGGSSPPPPVTTYTIGGTVSGLSGSGLVLQNNLGTGLAIGAAGAFSFPSSVASGAAYSVTVATQPSAPSQSCVVSNGSGTVSGVNVTNVMVDCTTVPFTALANPAPDGGYLTLLLTDGRVLMQSLHDAGVFYALTPDAFGSYVNGTWRQIASPPAGYAPYAGSQAVLADGRVLFVGGEYNQNNFQLPFAPSGLTNMAAIYDPVADAWTMIPPPAGVAHIGDPPSAVLPDGSFIFGNKLGRDMWRLDPVALTWTSIPATAKADDFAEEGWTLMPSGQLFTIDLNNPLHAEHYDPAAGVWYSDGSTPVALASPTDTPAGLSYGPAPLQIVGGVSYGPGPAGTYYPPGEIGPALLLPDGRVFATGAASSGSTGHTAIFTPAMTLTGAGSFVAGPDFATGDSALDSSACLLPSGHVLITTPSGRFYEYDGVNMPVTGTLTTNSGNTSYFVLPLPNGQALVSGGATQVYDGGGAANPAWAPAIAAAPTSVARGSTYVISGTQFNGMSQAANVGDELSSATNYPLVRITNTATGHVFYARTHDHSSMGVATGSAVVSTQFTVAAGTDTGAGSLVVVANGIASAPVTVTVN